MLAVDLCIRFGSEAKREVRSGFCGDGTIGDGTILAPLAIGNGAASAFVGEKRYQGVGFFLFGGDGRFAWWFGSSRRVGVDASGGCGCGG